MHSYRKTSATVLWCPKQRHHSEHQASRKATVHFSEKNAVAIVLAVGTRSLLLFIHIMVLLKNVLLFSDDDDDTGDNDYDDDHENGEDNHDNNLHQL